MEVYLLSCATTEEGGGIGKYTLTDGGLKKQAFYACDRPMYAVKSERGLEVLLRAPWENSRIGGYRTVDYDLSSQNETISTEGECPCHLCVDGGEAFVVNYLSGNLVKIGKKSVKHEGKGVNPVRQDMPHTHQAFFSPDKRFVLCCDLGLDTLFCYDRDLKLISKSKIADGYGIRHAVFSKDGKYIYALSEMIPAIHIFSFDGGMVEFKEKIDLPCGDKEGNIGAAIRLSEDGEKLYISLRVLNALSVYDIKTGKPRHLQTVDCGGDSPRDFQIFGEYLIVTNEKSNNAVVFALKSDGLIGDETDELRLPAPLCAL